MGSIKFTICLVLIGAFIVGLLLTFQCSLMKSINEQLDKLPIGKITTER